MNIYTPLQAQLDRLLQFYQVQGVGTGYIDLILPPEQATLLIEELSFLPIAVERMTWWCHCTPASQQQLGCPHGLGGPANRSGEGWFSECVGYPDFQLQQDKSEYSDLVSTSSTVIRSLNEHAQMYLERTLREEPFYLPCLHVGLWLAVPEHWKRPINDTVNNSVS